MFRCYGYTIIRERINLCLLKLHLLKHSFKIHRCVVNTVVATYIRSLLQSVCCTVYYRTLQHTDTDKDLIYAATPQPY